MKESRFSLKCMPAAESSRMEIRMKKIIIYILSITLFAAMLSVFLEKHVYGKESKDVPEVTLRVANWEEYIDEGNWDEDETIDLESGDIIGENPMIEEFAQWYYETYGIKVNVEYSTFGTNEDLYNMLTLGDVYDVVCPSEYMIMKLMAEDQLVPLSDDFFDKSNENNYYINGVSPYIKNIFETNEIHNCPWSKYTAGYMWGVTGFVYDPEVVSEEEASTWKLLENEKFKHQITMKDNVRDSYFAVVGALKSDLLTSDAFLSDENYTENLKTEMNDVSPETIKNVQDYLQGIRNHIYSFETDSGKADMITGKVVVNYQWSGDAVYTLDQAEEDYCTLAFAVPKESTNIYFDGWVMLKKGIQEDARKQHAAEAFMNYISRPDNVIRNMYYVGYTSVIAGGEDDRIFEYADWCYGVENKAGKGALEKDIVENAKKSTNSDTVEYPLGYFFSGDADNPDYVLTTSKDQLNRQLFGQYPTAEVLNRSSIMVYFDEEENHAINEMWIHVRCFNIKNVPVWIWVIVAVFVLVGVVKGALNSFSYS